MQSAVLPDVKATNGPSLGDAASKDSPSNAGTSNTEVIDIFSSPEEVKAICNKVKVENFSSSEDTPDNDSPKVSCAGASNIDVIEILSSPEEDKSVHKKDGDWINEWVMNELQKGKEVLAFAEKQRKETNIFLQKLGAKQEKRMKIVEDINHYLKYCDDHYDVIKHSLAMNPSENTLAVPQEYHQTNVAVMEELGKFIIEKSQKQKILPDLITDDEVREAVSSMVSKVSRQEIEVTTVLKELEDLVLITQNHLSPADSGSS